MWNDIWVNANLATMSGNEPYGEINDAAIAIDNGNIVWVGKQSDLPDSPDKLASQIHDVEGKWITPGLIDCHTHIVYGGNRAEEFEMRLNGATYEEIAKAGGGIVSTVKATRKASEEELRESAIKRLKSLIAEGVTTIEIKSGYGLDTENEAKMLRVARELPNHLDVDVYTTFLGAHALPPEYKDNSSGYIDLVCDEMLPAIKEANLADAVDAFCENIGFTPEETKRVFEKAKELGLPVKLHAEQLSDLKGAKLAASFDALSADHLEYIAEDGIKAMADSGTVAVLLPGAFYFLRETQLPPIDLFRENNVPIAIATDCNPGSSPAVSILLMMNMACTLFRMTPEESLAGVTRNAAKALGANEIGTLEVGKKADLVIWDIKHPAELSYAIGANPCHEVIKS